MFQLLSYQFIIFHLITSSKDPLPEFDASILEVTLNPSPNAQPLPGGWAGASWLSPAAQKDRSSPLKAAGCLVPWLGAAATRFTAGEPGGYEPVGQWPVFRKPEPANKWPLLGNNGSGLCREPRKRMSFIANS